MDKLMENKQFKSAFEEEYLKLLISEPIKKGKGQPVRAHWFKTVAWLFKARYLSD